MKISFVLICMLLVSVGCGGAGTRMVSPEARYRELVKIVDRNTGFAHFTRGMNRYTVEALQSAVGENDIPVLRKMLADKDRIVIMTATNVLMRMSAQGRGAVYEALLTTANKVSRDIIADQLADIPYDLTMKSRVPGWTEDIPLLKQMAESQDLWTIRAARDLLKSMGEPGRGAIREILATTKNRKTFEMLKEEGGR